MHWLMWHFGVKFRRKDTCCPSYNYSMHTKIRSEASNTLRHDTLTLTSWSLLLESIKQLLRYGQPQVRIQSWGEAHLYFRVFLPVHLIQELHFQDDSRVHLRGEGEAGDNNTTTVSVCKIQTFTSLIQEDMSGDAVRWMHLFNLTGDVKKNTCDNKHYILETT